MLNIAPWGAMIFRGLGSGQLVFFTFYLFEPHHLAGRRTPIRLALR